MASAARLSGACFQTVADWCFGRNHSHKLGKALTRLRIDPKSGAQRIGFSNMAQPFAARTIFMDVYA